jgi:hypothetical protein
MTDRHLLLLAPAANRVYADQAPRLLAAEVAALCPEVTVEPTTRAGVDYLLLSGALDLDALARSSAALALFAESGSLLEPVELPSSDVFDDDLVTIQRDPGKTNEQFTRLLVNLTLAAVRRDAPYSILDPLCGRGTTLLTGWTLGHDVAGVEQDETAIEQLRAFLSTYLRRKRIKHSVSLDPMRREGRTLGRRLEATTTVEGRSLSLGVLPGDAADSARLWGKRTFDAVVADAPYGVVHGAHGAHGRHRSPEALLSAALPVWAGQLRSGGALGLAWNTLSLPRERLVSLVTAAGLTVLDDAPYAGLEHRVDSSILRDVVVATKG